MGEKILDINKDGKVDGKDVIALFEKILLNVAADGKVNKNDVENAVVSVIVECFD